MNAINGCGDKRITAASAVRTRAAPVYLSSRKPLSHSIHLPFHPSQSPSPSLSLPASRLPTHPGWHQQTRLPLPTTTTKTDNNHKGPSPSGVPRTEGLPRNPRVPGNGIPERNRRQPPPPSQRLKRLLLSFWRWRRRDEHQRRRNQRRAQKRGRRRLRQPSRRAVRPQQGRSGTAPGTALLPPAARGAAHHGHEPFLSLLVLVTRRGC